MGRIQEATHGRYQLTIPGKRTGRTSAATSGYLALGNTVRAFLKEITPPVIVRLIRRKLPLASGREEANSSFHTSLREIQADEYLGWLCQILGGFLPPGHGNIAALNYAIQHMPDNGAVIEIGSFLGLSTNIIAYLAMKHSRNNPIFNCDPWIFEETEKPIGGYFDAGSKDFREYVKNVCAMNLQLFSGDRKPYAIESRSEQFLRQWDSGSAMTDIFGREAVLGGPVSFAYIDGAHTYEAARNDFLGIDRHLMPGGFVLLDDSSDDSPFECKRVVAEIKSNPAYELAFRTPNYLFRKKVRPS